MRGLGRLYHGLGQAPTSLTSCTVMGAANRLMACANVACRDRDRGNGFSGTGLDKLTVHEAYLNVNANL